MSSPNQHCSCAAAAPFKCPSCERREKEAAKPSYRFVENRRAMEQVAVTMAIYTRLSGMHPDWQCKELRVAREGLRIWRERWRDANNLPCGHQDAVGDNLAHAAGKFYGTLNALRLHRGRIAPSFQLTLAAVTGDA